MNIQYSCIGERIQLKRKELNLRQNELAEKLDVSNNHLSGIENGREKPSLETLIGICNALKVTPDYLLLGNTHPPYVPESVVDCLRLCNNDDVKLVRLFCEILVARNQKNWNDKHYFE